MRKIKMPEWTKTLPGSALIGTPDILNIFEYKKNSSINSLVRGGYVPEPDKYVRRNAKGLKPKPYWFLKTLRNIAGDNHATSR